MLNAMRESTTIANATQKMKTALHRYLVDHGQRPRSAQRVDSHDCMQDGVDKIRTVKLWVDPPATLQPTSSSLEDIADCSAEAGSFDTTGMIFAQADDGIIIL